MLTQVVFRFIAGGFVVSVFAMIGDVLKPKSFAGLFGGAPSVALASLGLTVLTDAKGTAALEACSMIVGGIAFFCLCSRLRARDAISLAASRST